MGLTYHQHLCQVTLGHQMVTLFSIPGREDTLPSAGSQPRMPAFGNCIQQWSKSPGEHTALPTAKSECDSCWFDQPMHCGI